MFSDFIVNHISSSIVITNADLKILYANQTAEHFFRLSVRRLKELEFRQLFRYITLDMNRVEKAIKQNQSFTDAEVSVVTVDDQHSKIEACVNPIYHQGETYVLFELRAIDQIQRISQESFVQSQLHASRDLIRGLAHEIKNPLGGIRGAAQILDRLVDDEDSKECTQMIMEQSDRLRNLVDRLLGPNKLPQRTITNIHRVLEQVRQLMEMEAETSIQVYRDYDPSIPDFEMDAEQLHQVFLNIARNAMQAMQGQGKISLITRIASGHVIHGQHYKLVAVVKIIDTGPGIPDDIRDTLFYPMVTSKAEGSGLGLSIAQTLIQQHQGRIDCESWPGHTEFTVYLPIEK
ncbi:nitrogen regulation protein NR(II) [Saccharobesus litoralis]|uniref:histidine kinase n=1 Tax=Saccharobesus litoralis TaxID=2172099 RepID=A0A2S0VQP3_9ALTE|nr:nitrogen regulation protein NR(II) [Saccharobesus litoralis]AWB66533.1 nitrogen regulation protein NR(II) [Saccharobesus litoralis]